MGLLRSCLGLIGPHARNARILSLGYPDMVVSDDDLHQALGIEQPIPKHPKTGYPETTAVFEALGSVIEYVDIYQSRGVERIVDLNFEQDLGTWDLVLDAGTIEHCFNIAQAIMNAAHAVGPGGRIFHTPPLSMVNHGFYNICPTMLVDFYSQNGWEIETLLALRDHGRGDVLPAKPTARFSAEPESVLHCLARRPMQRYVMKYPKQTKYLQHEPGSKR